MLYVQSLDFSPQALFSFVALGMSHVKQLECISHEVIVISEGSNIGQYLVCGGGGRSF